MLRNFKPNSPKELEEKVLRFWEENKTFEKSILRRKGKKSFSFYDGPPFATGLPHYGHILATTIKDAVTRYWAMRGFKVERRVGWDCHGLPVENLIEKELGIKSKKEIEEMGVEKFNAACRSAVFRSVHDFENTLKRTGRWADYSNSYATLDNPYMESVWWVFKKLWESGLVYKDYRISPYCPRCGTVLSNFEVNQGYKEAEDISIYVKFQILDSRFPNAFFLAWTTTPWTLPGNAALAINDKLDYVFAKSEETGETLILAADRISVLGDGFKVIKKIKGKDLVGVKYAPLYPINNLIDNEIAYAAYNGNFVSAEDGTGIVHIAPAFGEDDYKLIKSLFQKNKKAAFEIPITVNEEGRMKPDVIGAAKPVQAANGDITADLKNRNLLFKTENVKHNYPFCWRCDTALLYYPTESWYVGVTKIKKNLVADNKKIHWVPNHIREGRFGRWLQDTRDWAVSRNRFWGTAIPVWHCEKCGKDTAAGSLNELEELAGSSKNRYFALRHGDADSLYLDICAGYPEKFDIALTKKGEKEIKNLLPEFRRKKIDLIFASDLKRAAETAEIAAGGLNLRVNYDRRLREYNTGIFNGRPTEEFHSFIGEEINKFKKKPEGGEDLNDVRARMMEFLLDCEANYSGKNILIVGHGDPLWVLEGAAKGLDDKKIALLHKKYIKPGELREIKFLNLPYDRRGRLDLHKPYIDEFELKCPHCGGKAKRIDQVFDCWFESGSMPYAEWHYPFENKELVEKTFPADFIAEGLDQTRGWFYTLHVLATALTEKQIGLGKNNPAFKNVIVNGLVLDEEGRKLSKKLRNYTEPEIIFEKYGADAMRFFLLSSTPIGEDYRFSDKGVEETKRKVIDRFINSYNFYALYENKKYLRTIRFASLGVLDKWILLRLDETIKKMTDKMNAYELTEASREIISFFDDLSNWYIRRSRRRFQKPDDMADYSEALSVLNSVLTESCKLLAPFSPFVSEAVYKSLLTNKDESVHLADWPESGFAKMEPAKSRALIKGMEEIRNLASLALAARQSAGIKVKQPLSLLKVKSKKGINISKELAEILADEINVKKVLVDAKFEAEIHLDTNISKELREEGIVREFARFVQDLRQSAGYDPKDKIDLFIKAGKNLEDIIAGNLQAFKKEVSAESVVFQKTEKFDAEFEKDFENQKLWLAVKKT